MTAATAADLVGRLVNALREQFPTRVGQLSYRPGRVTCVVVPTDGEFELPETLMRSTSLPMQLTVEVHVLAAAASEQGIDDLLFNLDAVVAIMRTADFTVDRWSASVSGDSPSITVTATAGGVG